jgi:hypothetical protein
MDNIELHASMALSTPEIRQVTAAYERLFSALSRCRLQDWTLAELIYYDELTDMLAASEGLPDDARSENAVNFGQPEYPPKRELQVRPAADFHTHHPRRAALWSAGPHSTNERAVTGPRSDWDLPD